MEYELFVILRVDWLPLDIELSRDPRDCDPVRVDGKPKDSTIKQR